MCSLTLMGAGALYPKRGNLNLREVLGPARSVASRRGHGVGAGDRDDKRIDDSRCPGAR
jgi:hypothetical protein